VVRRSSAFTIGDQGFIGPPQIKTLRCQTEVLVGDERLCWASVQRFQIEKIRFIGCCSSSHEAERTNSVYGCIRIVPVEILLRFHLGTSDSARILGLECRSLRRHIASYSCVFSPPLFAPSVLAIESSQTACVSSLDAPLLRDTVCRLSDLDAYRNVAA